MNERERLIRDMKILNDMFPYDDILPRSWGKTDGAYEYAVEYIDVIEESHFFHFSVEDDGAVKLRPVHSITDALCCMEETRPVEDCMLEAVEGVYNGKTNN